ncbi:MAG: serine/threonine protein kinase [Agathobacter sp.]|nr:serine/threonine protein kinase [Agathobacter sp.]
MSEVMNVNQTEYRITKLLGHGKGGYSYLAEKDEKQYVLKQIHHEPCDYYQFGNKIEAERNDYHRLMGTGIRIPKMLDIDIENERILKEYIDGPTIFDLVKQDKMKDCYLEQMREVAAQVYACGLNIDYFPTNFVVQDELIYYIDYECNNYMDEWNFENWGVKYWSKTQEFVDYISQHK